MIDLGRLQTFIRVVDAGSINRAAAQMSYTPSAISQQISKLERELGLVLLERFPSGVQLTPSGRLLNETARRILADIEALEGKLAEQRAEVVDTIRVAIFATAAQTLAVSVLRELRQLHPRLVVSLVEVEADQAYPMLLRGTVDVAVVHRWASEEQAAATPAGVDVVVLGTDQVDLLAPADDPLAAQGVVTFDDCVDRPWVQTLSGSVYDWWLAGKFSEAGIELKPAHRANEFSTQLALVEAGAGLALIPRLGRKRLSDSVSVLLLDGAPEREVFVAWRTSSELRPGIRTVRESFRRSWTLWSEE